MLLIILPLLLSPVWGQDAPQQSGSDIMEEVMGKLDEFKMIEKKLKEEMKLKIEEMEEMKLEMEAKMTTLESSLPFIVSAALRDVPYLMFAAYQAC